MLEQNLVMGACGRGNSSHQGLQETEKGFLGSDFRAFFFFFFLLPWDPQNVVWEGAAHVQLILSENAFKNKTMRGMVVHV